MPSDSLLLRNHLSQLYKNIGGESRLEAILKAFYRAMSQDLMIGFFFEGKDLDSIAMKQKEFLMRAMGASQSYAGKPPAQAHTALPPILAGHFDRRLRILEATLRGAGVGAEDIRTWVIFEESFRPAVQSKA